jgi:hypothetical protein
MTERAPVAPPLVAWLRCARPRTCSDRHRRDNDVWREDIESGRLPAEGRCNVATKPAQLSAPGLRMHLLEPKKEGRYAVWVDENYRVTYKFEGTNVTGVDYEDCH